jgi:hypothetical protein
LRAESVFNGANYVRITSEQTMNDFVCVNHEESGSSDDTADS